MTQYDFGEYCHQSVAKFNYNLLRVEKVLGS